MLNVLSTTPLSQKINLWIYAFTGYVSEKLKVNSAITGPQAYSTGGTIVPNIICQIIMNAIVQYIPEQHISYISPAGYTPLEPSFVYMVPTRVYW